MNRPLLTLLAFSLTLLTAGCGATNKSATERLENDVFHYNHALRWKHYDKAAAFLPEHKKDDTLDKWRDTEDDVRILEVDIQRVKRLDLRHADVTVVFRKIEHSSNVVRTDKQIQSWHLDADRRWRLTKTKNK